LQIGRHHTDQHRRTAKHLAHGSCGNCPQCRRELSGRESGCPACVIAVLVAATSIKAPSAVSGCQQPTTCNAPPAWSRDQSPQLTYCGVAVSMTVCRTVRGILSVLIPQHQPALTQINNKHREPGPPSRARISAGFSPDQPRI
jgi:hypothetical protein